jgi:hypothetical protein
MSHFRAFDEGHFKGCFRRLLPARSLKAVSFFVSFRRTRGISGLIRVSISCGAALAKAVPCSTCLRAIARRRMLYLSPAPVELGHRLIDNREAQMLFEVVVPRKRPGQD